MDSEPRARLVIHGLGRAEITIGSLRLVPDAGMLFPLALLLGQRAGEWVSRSELRTLLWPEAPDESARHSLRQGLYRLRKAGLAGSDRGDELLVDAADVESDLADALLPDWPTRADPSVVELASSVLPGFTPPGRSALGEFADQLRARVAAQHRRAVLHRMSATRREGRWREVEHWALVCLQADPLNEEATMARAEAAAMVGAKYEALEVLDAYLKELGDRSRVIGLPVKMLKRRISELADPTGRRVMATSAPFVGRHELLGRAQDTLSEARGGTASALWFVGPAGIGKSRLMREVQRASKMAGWSVVMGDARPSFADRPFALMADVLDDLLNAPGALGAAPHALSLMRQMGTVNSDEEPLPPEEARARQAAVYHAWADLMDAVLGETPLALLLDDAQWSDPLTLVMLARYLESRPTARLAIILSTRRMPTRDDTVAARLLYAREARVAPLTDPEIRDFTHAAGLGTDERFEEVTLHLGRASGGNPLFLGHLVHQHQRQHEVMELPRDLASLIDGQLMVLSKEATRLLQACALLGQHSVLPRIERVLGLEAPQLVSAFGELDDMLALPSDPGLPLAPHDLWSERVRQGMTSGVFRSLAVSVARVLESDALADGGIELSWDAARLYQESGEKHLAYATMMRCAEYLMRTGAAAEAGRAYSAASELAVTGVGVTRALNGIIESSALMGEWETLFDTATRLEAHDREAVISHALLLLEARWNRSASFAVVEPMLATATDPSAPPDQRWHAAFLAMAAADNCFDADTLRRAWSISKDLPGFPGEERARVKLDLVAETAVGDLDAAVVLADDYLASARRLRRAPELIASLRLASNPYRRTGGYERAAALITESSYEAERLNFAYARFRAYDLLAGLAIDYERYDDAETALRQADSLYADSLGASNRGSLNASWALCAIGLEQWEVARKRLRHFQGKALDARVRIAVLPAAARLRLEVHDEHPDAARKTLDSLVSHGDALLRHTGVDQIALAMAIGHEACGDHQTAKDVVKRFVTYLRRDRTPLAQGLKRFLD